MLEEPDVDRSARVDLPNRATTHRKLRAVSSSDHRVIVGQTGQNVLGLAIGAVATFAAQVLMTRTLGDEAFGVVTLTTQAAFIAAAATRFGMDVANVRLVAILAGRGEVVARARTGPALGRDRAWPSRCRSRWWPSSRRGGSRSGSPRSPTSPSRRSVRPRSTVPFAALAFIVHGRDPRAEDHAVHALLAVDRAADRVDRARRSPSGRASKTAGDDDARVRASWALALAIAFAGWEREQRRFPAHELRGRRDPGGAHGCAHALRRPPRAGDAVLAADLLDRPVRAVDPLERPGVGRRLAGGCLRRGAASRAGVVPVPHVGVAHVQPVRRRPAPSRRTRPAGRAVQERDPVDARGDDPRAARARDPAGGDAADLRRRVQRAAPMRSGS